MLILGLTLLHNLHESHKSRIFMQAEVIIETKMKLYSVKVNFRQLNDVIIDSVKRNREH